MSLGGLYKLFEALIRGSISSCTASTSSRTSVALRLISSALILSIAFLPGCGGGTTGTGGDGFSVVRGAVLLRGGAPIAGATIVVQETGDSGRTDQAGQFEIESQIDAPQFNLRVERGDLGANARIAVAASPTNPVEVTVQIVVDPRNPDAEVSPPTVIPRPNGVPPGGEDPESPQNPGESPIPPPEQPTEQRPGTVAWCNQLFPDNQSLPGLNSFSFVIKTLDGLPANASISASSQGCTSSPAIERLDTADPNLVDRLVISPGYYLANQPSRRFAITLDGKRFIVNVSNLSRRSVTPTSAAAGLLATERWSYSVELEYRKNSSGEATLQPAGGTAQQLMAGGDERRNRSLPPVTVENPRGSDGGENDPPPPPPTEGGGGDGGGAEDPPPSDGEFLRCGPSERSIGEYRRGSVTLVVIARISELDAAGIDSARARINIPSCPVSLTRFYIDRAAPSPFAHSVVGLEIFQPLSDPVNILIMLGDREIPITTPPLSQILDPESDPDNLSATVWAEFPSLDATPVLNRY